MSISQSIAIALAEAALPINQCKACERQGLPILPLRRALVADARPGCVFDVAGETHIETRMGLRTLRSGYLYVLLDQRVWQAYEVTAEGHLRRFNPHEPPPGPPPSLPAKCVNEDHDIPTSFLTLDTDTYGSAWLAFSSDAWPHSVLDAYKSGQAPAHRFEGLDLNQAREHPELLGLAMTPDNLQVDKQVFEYAQQLCEPFDSAHGFHSRLLRKTALRGFVVNAMNKHDLEKGVLAIVLDDTVGLVQEYNHQRLNWIVKRQAWREDPMRAYQFQTSQILQIIRATHREWAAQEVAPFGPQTTGDGAPTFVDPQVERQRIIDMRERESEERLEQRYHEPERAAFQAEYDQQEQQFQAYIDQNANTYAELCEHQAFTLIERYDYDGNDRESGFAYSKTMAVCLAGGITEAAVAGAAPGTPPPGTSEALWLKWLQDPNSPPYRAVLLRNDFLLAALLPSFSLSDPINWNDSDKLYSALSKVITSDEGRLHLRDQLKQAVTETQGALNAASQRLQTLLDPGIQQAVRRLNSASQYLYNGVHLIELQVQMKLGEYYALQSAHLRELQNKASATLAKARDRMMPSLEELKAGAEFGTRKVKPIIQSGLLSLAVLDPKVAHTMINVSVWVEGKAEVLQERLLKEVSLNINQLSHAAQMSLVDIRVAAGTLEPSARKMLEGIRISSKQASQMVRSSFSGLRGAAGSWELLLALGGMYLMSDSLGKNLKKAEEEIGAKSAEAMLALYGSSAGIIGGGIEALGIFIEKASPARLSIGRSIIRAGAIISVAGGVFDAFQSILANRRTTLSGDTSASRYHASAALSSALGAYAAYHAVFSASILGPLGFAIALGLIAYSLGKQAQNNESTPLELWVKRCHFGAADETPAVHWQSPNDADIAFSELNAATLGVGAALKFNTQLAAPSANVKIGGLINTETRQSLDFHFRLPNFTDDDSSYHWTLVIHRHGDGTPPQFSGGETLINEMGCAHATSNRMGALSALNASTPPKIPDYFKDSIKLTHSRREAQHKHADKKPYETVSGSVTLATQLGAHTIIAATLCLTYWPDRKYTNAYAEIELQEKNT